MTKIDASGDAPASDGPHRDTSTTIVTVGEILDRRVPLEWYESVAIVAGLCSRLAESGATMMPAAADIVLSAGGSVDVTSHVAGHSLVALPRLLHELLSVTTPPTPLRLLVLHTISTEGDKSPKAFGTALAYYERPGREGWIESARQRFLQAPFVQPAPGTPKPSEMLGVEPPAAAPAAQTPPSVRRTRLIATTLVACAALAALVVSQTRTSGTNIFAEGWHTVVSAAGRVADAGRSLVNTVSGKANPTPAGDPDKKPATEPAPATERPRSGHRVRLQVASLAEETDAAVEPGTADAAVDPAPAVPTPADTPPTVSTPELAPETTDAAPNTEARAGGNDEIVPPRLLDPVRLPSWAQPADRMSTNIIELDIAATGSVRRVRLLSPPARLTDMMILSAAKTWLFEPASSGGRAVPYTMTLNWVPPNR
jgi:hypothetical protein